MTTAQMPLHVAVGKRLAGKLRERGVTYEKLGELCGWSTSSISRRIRGETPLSLADLECIETNTGISIVSLLGDGGELLLTGGDGTPFRRGGPTSTPAVPNGKPAASNGRPTPDELRRYGGYGLLLPWVDSNHQPFGFRRLLKQLAAA